MGRLDGKVAFVTGAGSGIGAASALRFAREGAEVAGLDVVAPDSKQWAEIEAAAPAASFREADVRDEDAVEGAVAAAVLHHGSVDVLLNAAGVSGAGAVDALEAEEWDRIIDINLKGTYLVSKHVAAHMVARGGGGSIIHIASIEGLEGIQGQAAYNASKGGVVLLTKNMAIDYGVVGIRVNCLCPGLIDTPMTSMLKDDALAAIHKQFVQWHMLGRAGRPDEVAACALFLASDDASFVTGTSLVVDGGFTAGRRFAAPE